MPQLVEEGDEQGVEPKSPLRRLQKKGAFILYAVLLAGIISWEAVQFALPYGSVGKPIAIPLTREIFSVLDFKPVRPTPRAIVLFGTGDGGWSGFEEAIATTFQKYGYEVIGIDFRTYADSDYNLTILQADLDKIARTAREPYGVDAPPIILGGWSMGAAQVIAGAGGPNPPEGLVGLLVLDPCSRGRYGLRFADESNILPTGPGTFAVAEFAKSMANLRVVQWHAARDSIDSRAWLTQLTAPHLEYDFEQAGHYYDNDRQTFLKEMVESVPWLLGHENNPTRTARNGQ